MTHSQEAAATFSRNINRMDFNDEEFAAAICSDHRTLQQSAMRAILVVISKMAENYDNGRYDLRNEDSVKIAKKIVDAISVDGYMPGVPFI